MNRLLWASKSSLFAAFLTVVLAGCGSNSATNSSSTTVTPAGGITSSSSVSHATTTGTAAASLPDPCTLLTAADVSTVLGVAATASKGVSQDSPPFASCSWGSLTADSGLVSVLVSRPGGDGGIDYAAMLAGVTADPTDKPLAVGTGGKLMNRAVIAGGGGVGKTAFFKKNGITVVIGLAKTSADEAALTAAAQHASSLIS